MEVWKPIPGHDGYEVSDEGRVRSSGRNVVYKTGARHFHHSRILKQFTLWNGYKTTHLGSKHMNNYVHRFIMLAFHGPTPAGMEVCHNDGVKSHNRLTNLRFDTRVANRADIRRHAIEAVVDKYLWIWSTD